MKKDRDNENLSENAGTRSKGDSVERGQRTKDFHNEKTNYLSSAGSSYAAILRTVGHKI